MDDARTLAKHYAKQQRLSGDAQESQALATAAQQQGVFVHASPELTSLLVKLDLDRRVPPSLYDALSESLHWLKQLDDEM